MNLELRESFDDESFSLENDSEVIWKTSSNLALLENGVFMAMGIGEVEIWAKPLLAVLQFNTGEVENYLKTLGDFANNSPDQRTKQWAIEHPKKMALNIESFMLKP